MPTPDDLRKMEEERFEKVDKLAKQVEMNLADAMEAIKAQRQNDSIQEAVDLLQSVRKTFEKQPKPKVNHDLVDMISHEMSLSKRLDAIDQLKEPITIEAADEIEFDAPIEDLQTTENLVTMLENGFSNERSASRTITDIQPEDGLECEILPHASEKIQKLKHSDVDKVINEDDMLAAREAKMPEVRKQRAEQIKKLNEKAEEHRREAEAWLRKIVSQMGNRIEFPKNVNEQSEFMFVSGRDNAAKMGIDKFEVGVTFALQLSSISEKDGVPRFGFKLVEVKS